MITTRNDESTSVLERALSDVSAKYELKQVIGQGSFGIVRKCKYRETGEMFAVKTVRKDKVPNLDILKREIEILSELNHPHIIRLHDVYEDENNIHLVTELCTGGELYDRVVKKTQSPEGHFSEYDAARIIRNILDAIAYCHDVKHIVHRDLKAENFLLLNERDDAPVKIIDFGLSRHDFGVMRSRVGTPYYVAPEVLVLTDDYSSKCDIWSIGIIAYILLCGFPPFNGKNERMTLQLVKTAKIEFPSPSWDNISGEAKRFILRLLERDPTERPTASEAMQDRWLQRDMVQPYGVSRRASFVPIAEPTICINALQKTAPSLRMKANYRKRAVFQKLLIMIKVKKAVETTSGTS